MVDQQNAQPVEVERFWAKVRRGEGECWPWAGARSKEYGVAWFGGRTERVHRVAWVLTHGPVPAGMCVLRTCEHPRCVRPEHLRLGTHAERIMDLRAKGRLEKRPEPEDDRRRLRRYSVDSPRRRWTRAQDRALLDAAGGFAMPTIERRTGRTAGAIYARIRSEHGGGGLSRGSFTLRAAIAETGYERSQLLRARRALGQAWMRTSTSGRWMISVEQLEEITAWLKSDYWSVPLRLTECFRHRGRERPHKSAGLCRPCYEAVRGVARRLQLGTSVPKLKGEVDAAIPIAAPTDAARLAEYRAQLERRLFLLEPDLRQLARIRDLGRFVAGAAGEALPSPPATVAA